MTELYYQHRCKSPRTRQLACSGRLVRSRTFPAASVLSASSPAAALSDPDPVPDPDPDPDPDPAAFALSGGDPHTGIADPCSATLGSTGGATAVPVVAGFGCPVKSVRHPARPAVAPLAA